MNSMSDAREEVISAEQRHRYLTDADYHARVYATARALEASGLVYALTPEGVEYQALYLASHAVDALDALESEKYGRVSETRDKPVTRYVDGCGWQVDGHFARHRCRACSCETEPGTVFTATGTLWSKESAPACPHCHSFAVDLVVSYG